MNFTSLPKLSCRPFIREIALGNNLNSESFINVMEKIDPDYNSKKEIDWANTRQFMKDLRLIKK